MIILDAADVAPAPVALPWGEEIALKLQQKFYIRWEQFRDLALAIATCRHALDDGFLCVIVKEDPSRVSIWKALADTVPVVAAPKEAAVAPVTPQAKVITTYRGRPVESENRTTTPAQTTIYSYRGRIIPATQATEPESKTLTRPDNIFFRGRAV